MDQGKAPGSDPIYKRLYAFPDMVADLLRSVFPDVVGAVDMASPTKLSAEYVGDDFRRRLGDAVWRVRLRPPTDGGEGGGWLYALVLLEFQSGIDAGMALRVTEYTTMLHRELVRGGLAKLGALPPVLPVVLYNGEAPWSAALDTVELVAGDLGAMAPYQPSQRYAVLDERHVKADDLQRLTRAVAQLEQSRHPKDWDRVAGDLAQWLAREGQHELRAAFAEWIWMLMARVKADRPLPAEPPPGLTLEDVRMTLAERVSRWPERWVREGIEQGIEQGIERGIERGLHRQRTLLRRQAEARFGAATAERLFAGLQGEDDQDRLNRIGMAIVSCETGDELLRLAGV